MMIKVSLDFLFVVFMATMLSSVLITRYVMIHARSKAKKFMNGWFE
ncbi:hypothetical protein [Companilactobacillus furfuricola]|nr:hypothetical protein [Companilactobacillus furfuricola]